MADQTNVGHFIGGVGYDGTVAGANAYKAGVAAARSEVDRGFVNLISRAHPGVDLTFFNADQIGKCFSAGTLVTLLGGEQKPIEAVVLGDLVGAFDPERKVGRDALEGRRVVRLFENITDTWIKLSNGLTVTPGHRFLTADGGFAAIEEILRSGGRIVLEDGSLAAVTGEYIRYSAETAHLYEQAEGYVTASVGGLALAPVSKKGWKTYNFEVEGLHTYVAGGVRVHNESYDFVSKYDNQTLYPEQISRYDPDTNSWGKAVVWRPANDNTALAQELAA